VVLGWLSLSGINEMIVITTFFVITLLGIGFVSHKFFGDNNIIEEIAEDILIENYVNVPSLTHQSSISF